MKVNQEKLAGLMNSYCGGNYNRFARELQIDPSHLYRYINSGIGGGKKLIGAVMRFCVQNQLDFNQYIDL